MQVLSSIVRTVVPVIVGWLLSLPVVNALGITADVLVPLVQAIVTAGYYVAVRVVEVYVTPRAGWLLGLARTPEYQAR